MDLKKPPLQETHCHWPSDSEILNFFKPIPFEENEIDKKLLLSAEEFDIPFEGQVLKGYRWGKGRSVLLVHGWSSRASHMAFLARHLAKCGFSVTAFDGPVHGRSQFNGDSPRSSLPEFCRAIYHVSKRLGALYGIIGHSFGGAAVAFTVAGQVNLAGYRIDAEKIIIISSPSGIDNMIEHYCNTHGYAEGAQQLMTQLVEQEFPLVVNDYKMHDALGKISRNVLVVHDMDDKEIPINTARAMIAGHSHVQLVETSGEGHRRILVSKSLLQTIANHLTVRTSRQGR